MFNPLSQGTFEILVPRIASALTSSVTEVSSKLKTQIAKAVSPGARHAKIHLLLTHVHAAFCQRGHIVGNEITHSSHFRPLHIHVPTNFLGKTGNISGRPLQVLLSDSVQIQVYTFGNGITHSSHVRPLRIHVFH